MTKILEPIMSEFPEEVATTRRVPERVPADKLSWKPHPKSMSLGQMAFHVANIPGGLARIAHLEEFDVCQANFEPPTPKNIEEVHVALDQSVRAAEDCLNGMTEQAAQGTWRLTAKGREVFTKPLVGVIE